MIATISPLFAALRHTRNTLHYAGTASSIQIAAPRPPADDVAMRNTELERANKQLLAQLDERWRDYDAMEEQMRQYALQQLEAQGNTVQNEEMETALQEMHDKYARPHHEPPS